MLQYFFPNTSSGYRKELFHSYITANIHPTIHFQTELKSSDCLVMRVMDFLSYPNTADAFFFLDHHLILRCCCFIKRVSTNL